MYTISITDKGENLSHLQILWTDKPQNWHSKVILLQDHYLRNRGDSDSREIGSTINNLINLAISLDIVRLENTELAEAMAWSAVGMEEFFMLFYDSQVTEAFCNEIGTPIVVSHRKYGRCVTNFLFREELWSSLKIRSEYDTGHALSPISPALKVSFNTNYGNLRISLQIPPLTPLSPAFNMRRLPRKPLDVATLIEDKQISSQMARILIDKLHSRANIIIAGEPGSGKTTLANALLLYSETTWRLIVMEDAREVILPTQQFPMATRFFMPVVGEDNRFAKRSDEIARLLHRSPDYVFLGELQNAEDTKVAFEAFAAGISGMATTHARNFEGLMSRWINSHQLEEGLLRAIDFIVFTQRVLKEGRVELTTSKMYENKSGVFKEVKL
ncbi:MAG: type II/IV secretion system ATPase subunit [Candidatus Heimdallarchaeota archaeon]|nr:type II/IV secretion system ATPase subunit [Candidatus Heimdallarchaeota archaeon]